jgi:hypothetical protein
MADVPTVTWAEGNPAGSDSIREGDNRICEMKTQLREVIDVDHDFPSSGQDSDVGQHKQCTFQEQADLGTGAVNATILGSQTVDGKGELTYTDEDDNDVQITKAGKAYAGQVADAAEMDSDAAPTTDAGVANKKYVDDAIAAITFFGSWASKSNDTAYEAETGGFVVGWAQGGGGGVSCSLIGYTDSSNPPTTIRYRNMSGAIASGVS